MTTIKFTIFRLFIDFIQLWLLVVNPAYGFDIDADSPAWKAVSLINLNWLLEERVCKIDICMREAVSC